MSVQITLLLRGNLSSLIAPICAGLPASHAPGGQPLPLEAGALWTLEWMVGFWGIGFRVQDLGFRA